LAEAENSRARGSMFARPQPGNADGVSSGEQQRSAERRQDLGTSDPVEILPARDGPYLVRGPVQIRDHEGRRVELVRSPIALCRCGRSQTRPFCDGTHQVIGFRASSEPEGLPTSGMLRAEPADPPQRRAQPAAAGKPAERILARARALLDQPTDTGSERRAIAGALEQVAAALRALQDAR
jgi:CDGSH-type Zn-finger protein